MPGSDWEYEQMDRDAEIQDALRIKMLEEEIQRFTNLEGQKVETMQQAMAQTRTADAIRLQMQEAEERLRVITETMTPVEQMRELHGIDLEGEMIDILANGIREEIDNEVLEGVLRQANEVQKPEKRMSEEDKYFDRLGL